jgi:superfamily II DNA or RNA helicase
MVSRSRPIQLQPTQHPAPVCADFEDRESVVAFEKAMRTHRAHSEPFDLTPLEGRVDGAWHVSGASGAAYVVDIVDGGGMNDACTCPDFLVGELGVCKHLEAVRRGIRARAGLQKAFQRLGSEPDRPTLTVEARGGLSLKALGAWPSRVLKPGRLVDAEGAAALPQDSRLLQPGYPETIGARVVHAVRPAILLQRTRNDHRRRAALLRKAAGEGHLGVDVLNKPLFSYQVEGVLHLLAQGRAILADDMGLGKTVQAIAACEVLRARGEAETVVIVTPASLKHQWAQEIQRYTGRTAAVVGGGAAHRSAAFASSAPYKILSYELTWRELHRLRDLEADVLILDEAQRAKNFRTRTATTLKAIPSRFLFVLTGTPIENRLDDLYSLFQILDPGILGPLWRFNLEHHQQGRHGKVLGCKNMGRLRERIAPYLLRRRKEAVLDQLPDLTEQTRYTALTAEQAEFEEGCRAEAARYLAIADRRPLTLQEQKALQAALLKARQACDALELADPLRGKSASPKLDEFEAFVSEVAGQGTSKILVFSEWVEMLKLAAGRLDKLGIGWTMLTGQVPTEKRGALLDRFRTDASIQVLLSSDAGGVGLNLQVANYVAHLDLPWNPARLDQRTARAHRLGQTRGVSVTYFCSESGIERGIEGTLAGKRALRSAALDEASEVEGFEVQGFSVFLRQLQAALARLGAPEAEQEPKGPEAAPVQEPVPEVTAEGTPAAASLPCAAPAPRRAQDRLRLAQVVLEAGFPGDAVKSAYDALAAAVGGLMEGACPATHDVLVAAIYRDLVPQGKLPLAVPGLLARLNDLASLQRMGVDVDAGLAGEALEEVRGWVERLLRPDPS